MYGSCQRSAGITPRYFSAAALTIAEIASRSSSPQRRIAILGSMTQTHDPARVWLITGASSGLGRALAEAVLDAGHRVVATARDPESVTDLERRHPGQALAAR